MKKLWWRIRLFILLIWFRYTPRELWNLKATWRWTGHSGWLGYYDPLKFSPLEAIRSDRDEW